MIDLDRRKRLAAARAEIAELLKPEREAKAKAARDARKAMRQRIGKPAEGQKQWRETDGGFLAFLRRQPCAVAHLGGCGGPVEAAHVRYSDAAKGSINPGMQRKNHDRHCNPLCRTHHAEQHKGAERAFWDRAGLDAYDNAARLYAAYLGDGR
jgi:hypothetical protein